MSGNNQPQRQRNNNQMRSLREESSADSSKNFFNLRKGVRDFAVVVLILNVLNVILYNTGWIDWKNDSFDTIWATSVCVLDVAVIVMFQLLDR